MPAVPAATPFTVILVLAVFVKEAIALLEEYQGVVGVVPLLNTWLVPLPVRTTEDPKQTLVSLGEVGAGFTVIEAGRETQPLLLV